jgi:hypothetical protein
MIDKDKARAIAAGWISSAARDANMTAFATGHPKWTAEGLADEVSRNLSDVLGHPERYDYPVQCRKELRRLLEWARSPEEHTTAH